MKRILLIISILYAYGFRANPTYLYFNGGLDHSTNTTVLPVGSQDGNWKVSRNLNGTYVPAIVCQQSTVNPVWWGNGFLHGYLTAPPSLLNNCPGLSNHGCQPGVIDLYYRIDFMVTALPFYIELQMRADNSVVEVFQNSQTVGSANWSTPLSYAQTLTHVGYQTTTQSWIGCTGWNVNSNNYIIVHTRSQSPQNGIDKTGFEVLGWTVNPVTVMGSPTICAGTTSTYSVAPVVGATSYVWNLGGGLTGTSTSNVINVTAPPGIPSGTANISVAANSTVCLNSGNMQVSILPAPVLNILPSSTLVCQGTPVTLLGMGASTYTWNLAGGGTSGSNPITVSPYASTNTYTFNGTGANGCKDKTTITINTNPLPTVFITPNTFFTCPGITNTLTASGASTYTWTSVAGNPTTNPLVINLAPSETVTVVGTNSNGCVGTTTLAFYPGTVIPVSAPDVVLCTNAATCTTLSATSTFPGWPPTFTWQPGGFMGSTATVCPTTNTSYVVTASSPGGCPNTATVAVSLIANCCSQPTTGLIPLTATNLSSVTLNGGSYLVNNDITLTGTSVLQNLEILMKPGVKITVPNGIGLYIEHVHLYACGIKMWQGLEIQDGGFLSTTNAPNSTSLIEDAEIAVDLPGTSLASSTAILPPFSLNDVIFNKNYIGIYVHNADPAITLLSLPVTGCVFSSRDLPFTAYPSALSWPGADVSASGLRFAATPTTGLTPPYTLQGYAQSNLKTSYNTVTPTFAMAQPAHIGIKVENVGNTNGVGPNTGVKIGATLSSTMNNAAYFNLFDGLGRGIEVTDASFSTANNVFQNMQRYPTTSGVFGGHGINHTVNSLMNASLELSPLSAVPATDFGNRFWNCWNGINTKGVFNIDMQYAVFRSTRTVFSGFAPGSIGIIMESNRFRYTLQHNEFNNIDFNIWLNVKNGPYDVGNPGNGTYADKVTISQNYFGPEVTSATPVNPSTEYCGDAITIDGTNGSNWQIVGSCDVYSNKIDRAHRGIRVKSTGDYPVTIGGNSILIKDDYVAQPTADQYGIYVLDTKDNLTVDQNTVTGNGYVGNWNMRLKLIRLARNLSANANSPVVTCNTVSEGYVGFEFEGQQLGTIWKSNILNQKMKMGLSLINQGAIGIQGTQPVGSGNMWNNNSYSMPDVWSNNWQTYVDNSSPAASGSFIWGKGAPVGLPVTNGGNVPFTVGPSLGQSLNNTECTSPNNYPSVPSQRFFVSGVSSEETTSAVSNWNVDVYPNPSTGVVMITSTDTYEHLTVTVTDLTGKVVYTKQIAGDSKIELDLSDLKASIYLVEIQNETKQTVRKKLVKTD
jgi:hypothetical protein